MEAPTVNNINHHIQQTDLIIAKKVYRLRREMNLALAELAKMIDIDESVLEDYEHGVEPIPASALAMMSAAFGVDFDYFYNTDESTDETEQASIHEEELSSVH